MAPRYAIYFVPERDSPLYRFGSSVIGCDCYDGAELPFIDGVDAAAWPAVVAAPRVYGFHATLKAPFYLAAGAGEGDLTGHLGEFACQRAAIAVGELAIREIGSFIALVPQARCAALDELAADCVREFDRFRAPLSAADRERRLAGGGLTPRQTGYLDRWGYPYVFEEFRFHMTLTGPLDEPERQRALAFLRHKFEMIPAAHGLLISQIAVVKQSAKSSPFRVVQAASLQNRA